MRDPALNDPAVVVSFHYQTDQTIQDRDRPDLVEFPRMVATNRPDPFKAYPTAARVALPTDFPESTEAASAAATAAPIGLADVARLLFLSAGVTRMATRESGTAYFRAAPSAGNLHPLEVYVVVGEVDGLDAGLYHFAPLPFELELLRAGDQRRFVAEALASPAAATAPFTVIVSGIPWRTAWKYAERGLRHIYWDAGTMLANFLAVAEATNVRARTYMGFVDAQVNHLLGLDGTQEFAVGVVTVGERTDDASPTTAPASTGGTLDALDVEPAPSPSTPIDMPLAVATQAAGNLTNPDEVASWRAQVPGGLIFGRGAPKKGPTKEVSIDSVVLRRGSTRLMRHDEVPNDVLQSAMTDSTRAIDGDLWDAGTLLQHGISVHAVEGVAPGRYHWADGKLVLVTESSEADARAEATKLCVGQHLGGDSAFTVFECAPLDHVFDSLGARGYRAAQLESGIVCGRLHLAAYARGYGATGLTFFDDEVSRSFETTAACMLVTSVGVPDYTSVPGGRPGHTAELPNFNSLMTKLMARIQADADPGDADKDA